MAEGWRAVLRVWGLVACATCLAAEPIHVRPRDPRLQVERLVRRLDWRDGLPVSYVVAAAQDRDGFVWVAGPAGLSRYDGTGFTTIYRGGTTLISGSAESGTIVFSTAGGLAEVQGERWVDLEVPESATPHVDWAAAAGTDGSVW